MGRWVLGGLLLLALALVLPSVVAAQARDGGRIAATATLAGKPGRMLSFSLVPTSDGRARGTLGYSDRDAKLRFRAERIDQLTRANGAIVIVGQAAGVKGGGRFRVVVRAPRD